MQRPFEEKKEFWRTGRWAAFAKNMKKLPFSPFLQFWTIGRNIFGSACSENLFFFINSYNFVKDIKSKFWTVYDIRTFQKWSYPRISGLGKNVVAYHFWSAKMIWRGGPTKLAWRKELCILSLRIILLLKGLPNFQ